MGKYTKIKKHNTKLQENECRIPLISQSKFMSEENFLRLCRMKQNPKGSPFGKKSGVSDIECRGCHIGEKIAKGSNRVPVNILFLGVI